MTKQRIKNAVRIVLEALCASLIFASIMLSILLGLGVYLGRESELIAYAQVTGDIVAGDLYYILGSSSPGAYTAFCDDEVDFYMCNVNGNTPPAADTFTHIVQVYHSSPQSDITYFVQHTFTTTPSYVYGDLRYNYTGTTPRLQYYNGSEWVSAYTYF